MVELSGMRFPPMFTSSTIHTLPKLQVVLSSKLSHQSTSKHLRLSCILAAQNKAVLSTIMKDLDVSGEVQLDNPDVAAGVQFLETVGLLGAGRAAQILSNTPL